MLKNIHLFTLLGLMLSGNILHCAQAPNGIASSTTQVRVAITLPKKHSCHYPECNKSFKTNSALTVHKRIHTGEKSFKCHLCNQSFYQLSNLKIHKQIHTGEKPFKCDKCDRAFTRNENLKSHLFIHISARHFQCDKFQCDQCNVTFSAKQSLTKHFTSKTHAENVMLAHAALASAQDFMASHHPLLLQSDSLDNQLFNLHPSMIQNAQHMSAEVFFNAHSESLPTIQGYSNIMPAPTSTASINNFSGQYGLSFSPN